MSLPAAKQNDQIIATDTHIVLVPSGSGTTPQSFPHLFTGVIDGNLSRNVTIMGLPAATQDSTATNLPPHLPLPPGVAFQKPPDNRGIITRGSATVFINGKPAARHGDSAQTCADPVPNQDGKVVAAPGTVFIG